MSLAARIGALALAVFLFSAAPGFAAEKSASLTFAQMGLQATGTLLGVYYTGEGSWRKCDQSSCQASNSDWGVDSATDALYMRWTQTHDAQIQTVMDALLKTAPRYPAACMRGPCPAWSDTPEWDAVTLMREYEITADPAALALAKAAFDYVDQSKAFYAGACPSVPFQEASGTQVKTLETVANGVKAALLLYQATKNHRYLVAALDGYAAARNYFFDPASALYTVHVIDDGASCRPVRRRYFASVNGDMIWNGITLWRITGSQQFRDEALATGRAVDIDLSDARGVFADVQGENDVVEPLVEAMYALADRDAQPFAAAWIARNAAAAASSRANNGAFSRFFDGPSQADNTIWESNGGFALAIAAAGLDPSAGIAVNDDWSAARLAGAPITTLPATLTIDGSGIALVGSLGRGCVQNHVRVFIDGVQTFDRTGLWENLSMPDSDPVLFAWRWPVSGRHTITLESTDSDDAPGASVNLEPLVIP